MRKFLKSLIFVSIFSQPLRADNVKISQLPLVSSTTTSVNDSFPFVSSPVDITKRLTVWDIVNVPTLIATYAPKASPTFTGTVTAPTFVGALTGNASTATALAANPTDCGSNTYANAIDASGNLTCSSISNASTTGVSTNTASTLVLRDVSGNFSAGTISAALTGTASGNTTYTANSHGVVVSGAANAMTVIAPDAATTKVLKSGGASSNPTWGQVDLATDVSGNLPVTNLNSGTSAGSTTFWRGDTTWSTAATSVGLSVPGTSIFGVTGTPVTTSGTLGLTTTGTSGGIPYFSSTSALSSSALLGAHLVVLGGGAGTAPIAVAATGASGTVLTSNGTGSDPTFQSAAGVTSSEELYNLGLAASVAANALTISLKQADGSTNPSSGTAAVKVGFGDATSANGDYSEISATSATSIVVPSGATLNTKNATQAYIYVYALNNAGTLELAVSMALFDEGSIQSSTTISNISSTGRTLYSTTGRSNVRLRLLARLSVNETTAGTWTSAPTEIALKPFLKPWPSLDATTSGGTAITPISTDITIAFATINDDNRNGFSSNIYTVPEAGVYAVSAMVQTPSVSATATLKIIKNGSLVTPVGSILYTLTTGNPNSMAVNKSVRLVAGDNLQITLTTNVAFTTTGTATLNYLSIVKVAD